MRQCAQCVGRVMRRKTDYGLMIFADQRFKRPGKYNKLPNWIKKCLEDSNIDLTIETAMKLAACFFRNMGKPFILSERFFKREDYFTKKLA
jgi:DNA excision repair protein ERCC-2